MVQCTKRRTAIVITSMSFSELGLIPEILRAVTEAGYTEPTPIQRQAIPVVLAGHDVMGGAQTGTGKTAGFTLPLLNRLARHASSSTSPARHPVRALILAPTRELAMQVYESVKMYSKHLPLRSTCIYGGVDMNPQIQELRRGIEIVVATPGRLLDHVQQKTIALGQVEFLILDEADRMLDLGFARELDTVFAALPKQRQTLLFSATFSDEIRSLAKGRLRDPLSIEVSPRNSTVKSVKQWAVPVDKKRKTELFLFMLKDRRWGQVLVFVKTKRGADELVDALLAKKIKADAIHGDKPQPSRLRALESFKAGEVQILVATDVAARGLDIDDLPQVVNFDLPIVAEDYIHRIGRTGRAGAAGLAVSFVSASTEAHFRLIEKRQQLRVEREQIPGFEPTEVATPEQATGGIKGSRPSKKDKLRAAAAAAVLGAASARARKG